MVRGAMLGEQTQTRSWIDRLLHPRLRGATADAAKTDAAAQCPTWAATPLTALRRPWTPQRVRHTIAGAVAVLVVLGSVIVSDINWGDFLTFWAKLPETAAKFWPPSFGNYDAAPMIEAMRDTIAIALAASVLTLGLELAEENLIAAFGWAPQMEGTP